MLRVYGIPNCDKIKKLRSMLKNEGVDYEFVDFKKDPPSAALIKKWAKAYGENPINKRGTTFRKIKDDYEQAAASDKIKIMSENSSAIIRPILEKGGETQFGYDEKSIREFI